MMRNKIANTCKSGPTLPTPCSHAKNRSHLQITASLYIYIHTGLEYLRILDHSFVSMSRLIRLYQANQVRDLKFSKTDHHYRAKVRARQRVLFFSEESRAADYLSGVGETSLQTDSESALSLSRCHVDHLEFIQCPFKENPTCFSVVNSSAIYLSP